MNTRLLTFSFVFVVGAAVPQVTMGWRGGLAAMLSALVTRSIKLHFNGSSIKMNHLRLCT